MGFIEFVVLCFVVVAIAAGATWILRLFVADCPAVIVKIIWGVAVFIIVIALLRAVGLMGHDPQIPRL